MPENTDRPCGTADAPSAPIAALLTALLAIDPEWTLKDSTGKNVAEIHLKHRGMTVCYLRQRAGSDLVSARYGQHNFNHRNVPADAALVQLVVEEADRRHAAAGAPTDLAKALAALAKPKRAPRKRTAKK